MGISITEDLIYGAEFQYTPGQSGGLNRRFIVNGLDPTNPDNCALACFATDATTGFYIPRYSDPHPRVPGFFARDFHGVPFGGIARSKVVVDVTYRPPENIPANLLIEIISRDGCRVVSRWPSGPQKGQPILVGYNNNPNANGSSPFGGKVFDAQINPKDAATWAATPTLGIVTDIVTVNTLEPGTILRFTRREVGNPLAKAIQYRRAVSSGNWQGQPAGAWLCTRLDGRSVTQGANLVAPNLYDVVYEFTCDPVDLWTQYPVYIDKLTGSAPQDIAFDGSFNGYTACQPYGKQDFSVLGLPNLI